MADKTGKTWIAVGETDDSNALIEIFTADTAITKGLPIFLTVDGQVTCAAAAQNCTALSIETHTRFRPCKNLELETRRALASTLLNHMVAYRSCFSYAFTKAISSPTPIILMALRIL